MAQPSCLSAALSRPPASSMTAVNGRSLRSLAAAKQALMMVTASSRLMARIPLGLREMIGWTINDLGRPHLKAGNAEVSNARFGSVARCRAVRNPDALGCRDGRGRFPGAGGGSHDPSQHVSQCQGIAGLCGHHPGII